MKSGRSLISAVSAFLFFLAVTGSIAEEASAGYRLAADGGIVGRPVVTNEGAVYCVTDGRTLVKAESGKGLIFSSVVDGLPVFLFRLSDGTLLVPTAQGTVQGFNPSGRKILSIGERGDPPAKALYEAAGGRIGVYDAAGKFRLYTLAGRKLLGFNLPSSAAVLPAEDGEGRFAAAEGRRIRMYRYTGRSLGEFDARSAVSALLWTADGRLLAAEGDGTAALYSRRGEELARRVLSSPALGLYRLPGGGSLILCEDGEILSLDAAGKIRWSLKGRPPLGGAVDEKGTFHVAAKEGVLTAYAENGTEASRLPARGISGPPGVSPGGRYIAAGGNDWVLTVFERMRYGEIEAGTEKNPSAAGGGSSSAAPARTAAEDEDFRNDLDFLFLWEKALSPSYAGKARCLDELEKRFRSGAVGKSADYASMPLRLLAGGSPAGEVPQDLRNRAARLLGLYGSRDDRDFLADLLSRERNEDALLGVVSALGELRSDPNRKARKALAGLTEARRLTLALARAILETLELIGRHHGGPALPEDVRALDRLFGGPHGKSLRGALQPSSP